jgi:hypothetical protein
MTETNRREHSQIVVRRLAESASTATGVVRASTAAIGRAA